MRNRLPPFMTLLATRRRATALHTAADVPGYLRRREPSQTRHVTAPQLYMYVVRSICTCEKLQTCSGRVAQHNFQVVLVTPDQGSTSHTACNDTRRTPLRQCNASSSVGQSNHICQNFSEF